MPLIVDLSMLRKPQNPFDTSIYTFYGLSSLSEAFKLYLGQNNYVFFLANYSGFYLRKTQGRYKYNLPELLFVTQLDRFVMYSASAG